MNSARPVNAMKQCSASKLVAVFEAFKGLLVLVVAAGGLLFVRADLPALIARFVAHSHWDPAAKLPGILLRAATHLDNAHLALIGAGALAYSLLRFVEAYGLFREKTWAQVLAALSGAVYIPFELTELIYRPGPLGFCILILNIAVVVVMLRALSRRRAFAGAG